MRSTRFPKLLFACWAVPLPGYVRKGRDANQRAAGTWPLGHLHAGVQCQGGMAVLCKHLSPDVCRRHGPGAINGQGLQGLLSAYFYGRSTALCSQDTHKAIKVPGISLQMIQVIMLRIQLCALDEAPRNMNFPLDKLKMIDYTISVFVYLSIYLPIYLSIYLSICMHVCMYVCIYIYIYALPAHTHAAATYYMKCRLLYRTAARRNGLLYSFFLTKQL